MKQLYRTKYIKETIIKTKSGTETITYISDHSNIKYGEFFQGGNIATKTDFKDSQCGEFYGKNKHGVWASVPYTDEHGWREYKRIYEKDFVSYSCEYKNIIIQPSDIHMQQLIKELPLDQFIEYMKDNGLGMESVR